MNDVSLCGVRANGIAVEVLKEFLALHSCQLSSDHNGPAHLLLVKPDGTRAGCLVRAGKIQRREKWSLTTHTWLNRHRVNQLLDWLRVQPQPTDAVIIFVLRSNGRSGPGQIRIADTEFHLLVIGAGEFASRMRPRSAAWDKVQVSSGEFENLAIPLVKWVSRLHCENTTPGCLP
jgi:hypothetical protein